LKFFKENNIKIIETSPFSLYNEKIDQLLDLKLFVSKTNLIKFFWKF
jgi:uridine kinase